MAILGDKDEKQRPRKVRSPLTALFRSAYPDFLHFVFIGLSEQRRKQQQKPRDSSTASGSTAAESVKNLLKKNPKYSKRINYDAFKDLFEGDGSSIIYTDGREIDIEEKEEFMYRMDEKSDGEGVASEVVVEEGGGGVGVGNMDKGRGKGSGSGSSAQTRTADGGDLSAGETLGDDDADGDDDVELSDKGEDYGWDEGYEQEV